MNHGPLLSDACDGASTVSVAKALDDPERAKILAYAEKMTHTPHETEQTDIESLKLVGFSAENIVDIIADTAYRNFANSIHYAFGHVEQNPEGPEESQAAIERLKNKIHG